MNTTDFAWAWRASGDRDRDEDLWMFLGEPGNDGPLAHRSGSREHGETCLGHDCWVGGGVDRSENSAISAAI